MLWISPCDQLPPAVITDWEADPSCCSAILMYIDKQEEGENIPVIVSGVFVGSSMPQRWLVKSYLSEGVQWYEISPPKYWAPLSEILPKD